MLGQTNGLPTPIILSDDFYQWDRFRFRSAPNRYRRMTSQTDVIAAQNREFQIAGYAPIGREISPYDWDEVIVWERQ